MKTFLEYLGLISGSIAIAFALLKWLSKKIFENYLQRSIEKYKIELEKVKITHEIQFANLHKERAEVIKQLYYSLYDYKLAILDFFDNELNKSDSSGHLKHKLKAWTNALLNFSPTFHRNKIFFSESQCELINTLNNEMEVINKETQVFLKSFSLLEEQINAINSKDNQFLMLKQKSNNLLNTKILILERQLENEFRTLLGVNI